MSRLDYPLTNRQITGAGFGFDDNSMPVIAFLALVVLVALIVWGLS